jgi:hypothetical protein
VNKIRHTILGEIEEEVAKYFFTKAEYLLRIEGTRIFQSGDPNVASLYVISGTCKARC